MTDLPRANQEIDPEHVRALCRALGLTDVLARIDAEYPAKPFTSDGVTLFPAQRGEVTSRGG